MDKKSSNCNPATMGPQPPVPRPAWSRVGGRERACVPDEPHADLAQRLDSQIPGFQDGTMDHAAVDTWITGYEHAWRSPGVERLADLFAADASYVASPWRSPIEGLDAIGRFWEARREGPDEQFDMTSEVLAVEDDVAVARVEVVMYGDGTRWRNLWIMRFAPDGRCTAFEEWTLAPDQPDE